MALGGVLRLARARMLLTWGAAWCGAVSAAGCEDCPTRTECYDQLAAQRRPDASDGWLLEPGRGITLVARSYDLDHSVLACTALGCNSLGAVAPPPSEIRAGTTLIGIELAGLNVPFDGDDPGVSLKIYRLVEGAECCTIAPDSLDVDQQAQWRYAASVTAYSLTTLESWAELRIGLGGIDVFSRSRWAATLDAAGNTAAIKLGGSVSARWLREQPAPPVHGSPPPSPGSTYLDYVLRSVQPDVDLDDPPNGLQRFELGSNARIETCTMEDGRILRTPACEAEASDGFSIVLRVGDIAPAVLRVSAPGG